MTAAYTTVRAPEWLEDFRFCPAMPSLDIDVVVVSYQAGRPTDLLHDGVAGIDAEPALNAAELGAIANVDASRANRHALVAVDAVADASHPATADRSPS